jgi:hypothetical protein
LCVDERRVEVEAEERQLTPCAAWIEWQMHACMDVMYEYMNGQCCEA